MTSERYTLDELVGMLEEAGYSLNELSPELLGRFRTAAMKQRQDIRDKTHSDLPAGSVGPGKKYGLTTLGADAEKSGDARRYVKRGAGIAQTNLNATANRFTGGSGERGISSTDRLSRDDAEMKQGGPKNATLKPDFSDVSTDATFNGGVERQKQRAYNLPTGPKKESYTVKEWMGMLEEAGYTLDEAGQLVGKQAKLDANQNGKLDGQDFKILRSKKKVMGGLKEGGNATNKKKKNDWAVKYGRGSGDGSHSPSQAAALDPSSAKKAQRYMNRTNTYDTVLDARKTKDLDEKATPSGLPHDSIANLLKPRPKNAPEQPTNGRAIRGAKEMARSRGRGVLKAKDVKEGTVNELDPKTYRSAADKRVAQADKIWAGEAPGVSSKVGDRMFDKSLELKAHADKIEKDREKKEKVKSIMSPASAKKFGIKENTVSRLQELAGIKRLND